MGQINLLIYYYIMIIKEKISMKRKKVVYLICIIIPFIISQISCAQFDNLENNYKDLSNKDLKIQQIIDMVNESIIRDYLEKLVEIGPRATGTDGIEKAADFLYDKFTESGLDTRFQKWTSLSVYRPIQIYKSKNVEATLKGNNEDSEMIVLSAHYDTVKVSPGANDDGSGVAAVLVAANILSQFAFNRTIKFVCFSAEEIGLLGSRAYVEELYEADRELLAVFNADMIGYAETEQGGKTFRVYASEDSLWMKERIKELNTNYGINFNIKGDWILEPGGPRVGSDFHDFLQYGYDVITFFEEDFNSLYFHTPEDTIEHINFSYLVNTTKLIIGTIAYFADIEMEYPQVRITHPRFGKLYINDNPFLNLAYHRTIILRDIMVKANVKPGNSPIEKVEFYYDNKLQFVDTEEPYNWMLDRFSFFIHRLNVKAYDQSGKTSIAEITFPYINLKFN
jgi:hypothetical protein